MRPSLSVAAAVLSAAALSGCVVAPVGPPPLAYGGAVHVQPAYPMPAPGYAWGRHPHYGYGWRHPHYGWHRGWR
jgi:hypothetical protein